MTNEEKWVANYETLNARSLKLLTTRQGEVLDEEDKSCNDGTRTLKLVRGIDVDEKWKNAGGKTLKLAVVRVK